MKPFDFNPTFLLAILNDRFYSVPRYQRSYAWDDQRVADFWNDMFDAIQSGREHFLGTIVLSRETADGTYSIVDGQQRVATTSILLAAMRDVFRANGAAEPGDVMHTKNLTQMDMETYEYRSRLRLNADDDNFYQEYIINRNSTPVTKDSHTLLSKAYDFFKSKLDKIVLDSPSTWKKELSAITKFLSKQARIIEVQAPTDADAFTIFETLNDRGADLTISDLLKNFLFSKSQSEFETVQQLWVEANAIIEELKPRTDFITFLRHLWSSRHGATRERDLYRKIKGHIKGKSDAVSLAKSIRMDAELYRAILTPGGEFWKSKTDPVKAAHRAFDRLNLEQIRPLLLAVLQHFADAEIDKSVKQLLSWSVRGLVAGVMGGGKAEGYFCDAAVEIRAGNIKTAAELYTALQPLIPSDTLFRDAFERFRTTNNGFARYLLIGVERHLDKQPHPELVPNESADQVNLEHLLPQRAKASEWPKFSPDEVSLYAYRLGNMTLLAKGPNDKIGNKGWSVKQPVIASSAFELNKLIAASADWTKVEIEARQAHFATLAPTIWPL